MQRNGNGNQLSRSGGGETVLQPKSWSSCTSRYRHVMNKTSEEDKENLHFVSNVKQKLEGPARILECYKQEDALVHDSLP